MIDTASHYRQGDAALPHDPRQWSMLDAREYRSDSIALTCRWVFEPITGVGMGRPGLTHCWLDWVNWSIFQADIDSWPVDWAPAARPRPSPAWLIRALDIDKLMRLGGGMNAQRPFKLTKNSAGLSVNQPGRASLRATKHGGCCRWNFYGLPQFKHNTLFHSFTIKFLLDAIGLLLLLLPFLQYEAVDEDVCLSLACVQIVIFWCVFMWWKNTCRYGGTHGEKWLSLGILSY